MSAEAGTVVNIDHAATAAEGDRVNQALSEAMLSLANLDRAIRNQPPLTSVTDLHPAKIAVFLKAAREVALAQHPRVVLEGVNVASEQLQDIIEGLIADPSAAVVNDPERMKDACRGMVRLVIEKYRTAVYHAFAGVRAEQEEGR